MGDSFQSLALSEAQAETAGRLAAEISGWLLAKGIVRQVPSIAEGEGRLTPGPNAEQAIDLDVREKDAWRDLVFNDVKIDTQRTVSTAIQGGAGPIVCPACENSMGDDKNVTDEFTTAVTAWHAGSDSTLTCPKCGTASLITKWRTEPFWAFSNLTVTFWNWPRLAAAFVDELSATAGHPIKIVRGKI